MDHYQINVPSILDKHPQLPQVLTGVLNLNSHLEAGAPIDHHAAKEAEDTAAVLALQQAQEPAITNEVIETASNRVFITHEVYSQAEFGVTNIHGALQQIQSQMASMNAGMHNFRIISHNSCIRAPQAYSPLQKSVHGHGHAIAQAVQPPGAIIPAHAAVPVVGAVPNNFNTNPLSYTHQEIVNMILFYNEDFFILPGDDIATRRNKFREWLSTL